MIYLLLGLATVTVTCQDIFKKKYIVRAGGGIFFFGGVVALFAVLWFACFNRDWTWNPALMIPSVGFALSYATATVCSVLAIRHGSLAKTALIVSCSLLVPSFYGVLFLKESISVKLILGLILLVIALALVNYEKEAKGSQPTTWKWVLFASLAFVGNGMCSTVQKAEQIRFGEAGKNVFMIMALAMVSLFLFLLSFFIKEERRLWKSTLKIGWHWGLLCGVANGLTNSLVMYLNPLVAASVMFPVISGGGIVLNFLYATTFLKEKFNLRQKLGFLIGLISVILLNL